MAVCSLTLSNHALAWDGDWTQAESGRVGLFDDPGSTQGQSGVPDPPQKFYTPAPVDYAEVDPEELNDYFNRRDKNYSPYALARITQTLHYSQRAIPAGYYLIKPGDRHDGSALVNLDTLNGPSPAETGLIPVSNQTNHSSSVVSPALSPQGAINPVKPVGKGSKTQVNPPIYETLVIKRQGKVVLVVPIHRRQIYIPARKDKIPARSLAWVEDEGGHPVLKFYARPWIYSTDFQ